MNRKIICIIVVCIPFIIIALIIYHEAQSYHIPELSIKNLLNITKVKYDAIKAPILKVVVKPSTTTNPNYKIYYKNENLRKCSIEFLDRLHTLDKLMNLEIINYIANNCLNKTEQCETNKLVGPLFVNKEGVSLDWIYKTEMEFVYKGGWWAPLECKERFSTAIIIPFRNREQHLPILLRQLHPILYRQRLHYRIFIIEQNDESTFNRGKLMNVGFSISKKFFPYNCFVFHDVDLIPEDDKIDYGCQTSPTHLSVAVDTFNYKLPYPELFGGVGMFTKADFNKINGFSNSFWLWGGEDDNLFARTKDNGMTLHRQSIEIARYSMMEHNNSTERTTAESRTHFLEKSYLFNKQDGLNTLQYEVNEIIEEQLYTHVKVDLKQKNDEALWY